MGKRKKRAEKPRRVRIARSDGSVGSLEKRISKDYGLPYGSVRLIGPDGKDKRSDAKIKSLLREWGL